MTQDTTTPTVTQADREAAGAFIRSDACPLGMKMMFGGSDAPLAGLREAFARHRLAHTDEVARAQEAPADVAAHAWCHEEGCPLADIDLRLASCGCGIPDQARALITHLSADLAEAGKVIAQDQRAMNAMLTGVSVHNRLDQDAPARKHDIAGEVVDALADASRRARQWLAQQEKKSC